MENRKFRTWLPLLISLSMVAGMLIGYKMRDSIPGRSFFYKEKSGRLKDILQLIETRYVDDVSADSLMDTAITAMLSKLDPHTMYIPASELEQINDDIKGGFFGIGVEFNLMEDTVHVINVVKDGPSFRAGLQMGDKIIRAGDSALTGKTMDADRVRNILRGQQGSEVIVTVIRNGKQFKQGIIRDIIPLSSVDAAYMLNANTGYIRLNKFSQETYREFMENLERLKKEGMTSMVLDLRDNGGGVLDEAVEIADELLPGDKLITYTQGKHLPRKDYLCRRKGQFEEGKLVVLINEGTASASEILSGALQDWERATIIGRRSFGKGLVQEQFDLPDNSALRLTVARYYTPLGRSIQRSYANGGKAYYEEIADRYVDGEYLHANATKQDTSKKYYTLKGKVLYGGGGISPDVFVGGDTGRVGNIAGKIMMAGTLSQFGYKYVVAHPGFDKKYPNPESFIAGFKPDTETWNYLERLASADSISIQGMTMTEKNFLEESIRRSIARQLWRNEGYFRVTNADDKMLKEALQILK